MNKIPAIVIRQPWASLIVAGVKAVENRTWRTRHRGPLVIVAGRAGAGAMPRGVAIGVVDVVDVVDGVVDDPYAVGPVCWILRHARSIEPRRVRGRPGLFMLPSSILA